MATNNLIKPKVFLSAGSDNFTVSNSGVTLIANSGADALKIASGVSDITTDANVERIELAGNFTDYKFAIISGSGVQIQSAAGTVIGTIPSLNQNATLAFADGSATLMQTGGAAFSLGGLAIGGVAVAVAATLNTTDKSSVGAMGGITKAKIFLGAGDNNFTISNSGAMLIANSGLDVIKLAAGVTDVKTDANVERIELAGNAADFKFGIVAGSGVQIQTAAGAVVGTIPSLNQNATIAFADVSKTLVQTGGAAFALDGQAISAVSSITITPGTNTVLNTLPIDVSVAGAGSSDASVANNIYTIAVGNYTYNIAGFGAGDVLRFPDNIATSVFNSSPGDGVVDLTWDLLWAGSSVGQMVTIHLTGLSSTSDAQLNSVAAFNTVFGAGSVV